MTPNVDDNRESFEYINIASVLDSWAPERRWHPSYSVRISIVNRNNVIVDDSTSMIIKNRLNINKLDGENRHPWWCAQSRAHTSKITAQPRCANHRNASIRIHINYESSDYVLITRAWSKCICLPSKNSQSRSYATRLLSVTSTTRDCNSDADLPGAIKIPSGIAFSCLNEHFTDSIWIRDNWPSGCEYRRNLNIYLKKNVTSIVEIWISILKKNVRSFTKIEQPLCETISSNSVVSWISILKKNIRLFIKLNIHYIKEYHRIAL